MIFASSFDYQPIRSTRKSKKKFPLVRDIPPFFFFCLTLLPPVFGRIVFDGVMTATCDSLFFFRWIMILIAVGLLLFWRGVWLALHSYPILGLFIPCSCFPVFCIARYPCFFLFFFFLYLSVLHPIPCILYLA